MKVNMKVRARGTCASPRGGRALDVGSTQQRRGRGAFSQKAGMNENVKKETQRFRRGGSHLSLRDSKAVVCFAGLGPDDLPSQADSIVRGTGNAPQVLEAAPKPPSDIEYLQELIAIQQNGPKNIGFFGTRNMGFLHQQLIEILSYAMVLTNNHIFTSGATGTNAAVIRGALRAERPELLTVVLPQSISKQPPESQELLKKVENVIEMPDNDELTLFEASSICNDDIISRVQQIICFAFHDSNLLLETCAQAKENKKMVTLFYLD